MIATNSQNPIESPACPLCGGREHRLLWRHTNRLFGADHPCHLLRCHCGMLLTSPQLSEPELSRLYDHESYYTHRRHSSWGGRVREMFRRSQMKPPLRGLRLLAEERFGFRRHLMRFAPRAFKLQPKMRLLDFGSGSGQTLELLRHVGLDVYGVEPDSKARKVARASDLFVVSELADIDGQFDRIVLSHVLEHLRNPQEVLVELRQRLVRDGKILIRVPNAASAQAVAFGAFWIGYDMPRHLWHFTAETLERLLRSAGFRVLSLDTVELVDFAIESAREMAKAGESIPRLRRRGQRGLEIAGRGAELVAVVERE